MPPAALPPSAAAALSNTLAGDVATFLHDRRDRLNVAAAGIHDALSRTADNLLAIGQTLAGIQSEIGKVEFRRWYERQNFGLPYARSQRLIILAKSPLAGPKYNAICQTARERLAGPRIPATVVAEVERRIEAGTAPTAEEVDTLLADAAAARDGKKKRKAPPVAPARPGDIVLLSPNRHGNVLQAQTLTALADREPTTMAALLRMLDTDRVLREQVTIFLLERGKRQTRH